MLGNAPIRAYMLASNIKRARKFYEEIVGLQPGAATSGLKAAGFDLFPAN